MIKNNAAFLILGDRGILSNGVMKYIFSGQDARTTRVL
jgi:hypothetical protein